MRQRSFDMLGSAGRGASSFSWRPVRRLLLVGLIAILSCPADGVWAARYAFLVGVGKYTTKELKELKYAENDVTRLQAALQLAGYDVQNHIVTLTLAAGAKDPRYLPMAKNICEELQLLIGRLRPGDSLLVALAGHGVQFVGEQDSYFCPADCDLGDRTSLISLRQLYDDLDWRCQASTKVLLVDACRNDPVAATSRSRERVTLQSVTRPQQIPLPGGIAAFYSCSPGQEAHEDPDYGQGIFFYHVVQGLQGLADVNHDAVVTLTELASYVVPKVEESASVKRGASQRPEVQQRGSPTLVELTVTNSIGMKLRPIPAGEFLMGTSPDEVDRLVKAFPEVPRSYYDDESPAHLVRITRPFYLGVDEVTVGQFRQFVRDAGYKTEAESDGEGGHGWDEEAQEFKGRDPKYTWQNTGWPQTDDHPVVNVAWNDAKAFCDWLSGKELLQYRLPTEAEWEYACRGGTTTWFYSGNDPEQLTDIGNVADATAKEKLTKYQDWAYTRTRDGYVFTAPVGRFRANGFGLYDITGNVWEWCGDWYGSGYYASSPTVDPQGPLGGSDRVCRGGGWYRGARCCRAAFRSGRVPSNRNCYLGFRLARQFPASSP